MSKLIVLDVAIHCIEVTYNTVFTRVWDTGTLLDAVEAARKDALDLAGKSGYTPAGNGSIFLNSIKVFDNELPPEPTDAQPPVIELSAQIAALQDRLYAVCRTLQLNSTPEAARRSFEAEAATLETRVARMLETMELEV